MADPAPAAARRCPECGEPDLPARTRFCPECGSRLDPDEAIEIAARKTATLVFCDVAGSTSLGEQLDPETLRAVMGRYFAVTRAAVERHGGTVEKFVGDAVLAVFGIPEVREDDALRAVRAAADLMSGLDDLAAELDRSIGVRLTVRTGVNTGPVVAGSARAGGAFATGDAVNTAARLEQAAPPGGVLLGATTYALVRDAVEVAPVDPVAAKGKAEPVVAHLLVRVLDTQRGRTRPTARRLIGRDRQVHAIRDAYARCVEQERCEIVTVLGPAGIGKSTLVEHVVADLPDATVLTGRCLSYGTGITFLPIVQALRQASGLEAGAGEAATRTALAAVLDGDPNRELVVTRLLPLLGVGGEPGVVTDTWWAVGRFFERLTLIGPVVLAIDDVHWAEPLLLDLLDAVREDLRDSPLLLLVQARPEFLDARPGWGGGSSSATALTLDPLGGAETDDMVRDVVVGADLPPEVGELVARWAGGVPLFVQEVVTHLIDEGRLRDEAGRWVLDGDLRDVSLPPSLSTLLTARLDRLPPAERALLEWAAVVGLESTGPELLAVTGRSGASDDAGADRSAASMVDDAAIDRGLASLQRREILRRVRGSGRAAWAFRHVLIREAAYDAMPKSTRSTAHERLAAYYAGARDAGAETAALAAHHLQQAVALQRSLRATPAALRDLLDRTIDATSTAMSAAWDADNLDAASAFAGQAAALCPHEDIERRREFLLHAALLALLRLDPDAVRTVVATMPAGRTDLDELTAAVLSDWAAMHQTGSGSADSTARAQQLADRAQAAGDTERLVIAAHLQLMGAVSASEFGEVDRIAREIARVGGARARQRAVWWQLSSAVHGPMPVSEGLVQVRASRADPAIRADTALSLDLTLVALLAFDDQLDAARSAEQDAVARALAANPFTAGSIGFHTTHLSVAAGDLEGAIGVLQRSAAAFEAAGNTGFGSSILGWLALLLLTVGRRDEGAAVLDRAEEATTDDDVISIASTRSGRALLAAVEGDGDRFAELLPGALVATNHGDNLVYQGLIRWALASGARRLGDPATERTLLLQARALWDVKGARAYVRLADARLAELGP